MAKGMFSFTEEIRRQKRTPSCRTASVDAQCQLRLLLLLFFLLLLDRLLDGLDEMSRFLFGHQPGGVGLGFVALGVFIFGNLLVRIVEDTPYDAHARHFGRARSLRL